MSYKRHESLGALVNVVAFRVRREFDRRAKPYGLDNSVWPVLVCLWEQDGMPQTRIADYLHIPGYAISRGVDKLVKAGFVRREVDPANRRVRRVFLTPAGYALRGELEPLALAGNAASFSLLTADEQLVLRGLLQKLCPEFVGDSR